LPKDAAIIDIGAGESRFVDFLLENGYQNISVLDISQKAIEKKQESLGEKAKQVQWIVSDIVDFVPTQKYAFWHDRAAFHFLTEDQDIEKYQTLLNHAISENGVLLIGTFSETGPKKCSGLEIRQYSSQSLEALLGTFQKMECWNDQHPTPFDTLQDFIFCSFRKLSN